MSDNLQSHRPNVRSVRPVKSGLFKNESDLVNDRPFHSKFVNCNSQPSLSVDRESTIDSTNIVDFDPELDQHVPLTDTIKEFTNQQLYSRLHRQDVLKDRALTVASFNTSLTPFEKKIFNKPKVNFSKSQLRRIKIIRPNSINPIKIRMRIEDCLRDYLPTYDPKIFLDLNRVHLTENTHGDCPICNQPKHSESCLYCAIATIPSCRLCLNKSVTGATECAICSGPEIVGPNYTFLADDELYFRFFLQQLYHQDEVCRTKITQFKPNTMNVFLNFNGKTIVMTTYYNHTLQSIKPLVGHKLHLNLTDFSIHKSTGTFDSLERVEPMDNIFVTLKLKAGGKNKNNNKHKRPDRDVKKSWKKKDIEREQRQHYENNNKKKYHPKLSVPTNRPTCYICYGDHKAEQCNYLNKPLAAYNRRKEIGSGLSPEGVRWHIANEQQFVDSEEDYLIMKEFEKEEEKRKIGIVPAVINIEKDEFELNIPIGKPVDKNLSKSQEVGPRKNNAGNKLNLKRDTRRKIEKTASSSSSSSRDSSEESSDDEPPRGGGGGGGPSIDPDLPPSSTSYEQTTLMLMQRMAEEFRTPWISYLRDDPKYPFGKYTNRDKFEIEIEDFILADLDDVRVITPTKLEVREPFNVVYTIKRLNKYQIFEPILTKFLEPYKTERLIASFEMLAYALTPANTLGDPKTCLIRIRNACTQYQKFNIERFTPIKEDIYRATELLAQHYYLKTTRKLSDFQLVGVESGVISFKLDTTPKPQMYPSLPRLKIALILNVFISIFKIISMSQQELQDPHLLVQAIPNPQIKVLLTCLPAPLRELVLSLQGSIGTFLQKFVFILVVTAEKTLVRFLQVIHSSLRNG